MRAAKRTLGIAPTTSLDAPAIEVPDEGQPATPVLRERTLMWRALRRDPLAVGAVVILALFILGAVFAPWLTPYPEQGMGAPSAATKLTPPSAAHWLGTDDIGRDVLARILYGGRTSLSIGFLVVIVAAAIGVPLGAIAGYFGGWIDNVLMRVTDIFLSFPPLLLAIAIAAALSPSFINTMIAIAITWWPWYARLVRGQTMSLRSRHFIQAARGMGVPHRRVISTHILPNVTTPVLVQATLDLGSAILMASAVSFVGLGVQPPTADWGDMVNVGRVFFLDRPWFAGAACAAIFLVVLCFNLLGDAVRDVLDPQSRRSR